MLLEQAMFSELHMYTGNCCLLIFCEFLLFLSLYQEIKLEWGKGLAQKREMEVRLQELENEKDKPFARSRFVHY